jgi:CBS domain containing-hemolysin-like protein
VNAVTLERTATAADVIAEAARTGHSRFPVLGEDVDDVIGVAHVKTAYGVEFDKRDTVPVAEFMSEPLKVPETAGVGSLLGTLRGRGFQIAVVVDEYGGTAGIVTLEDLVEELVGEVEDEHDPPLARVRHLRDGRYVVSGLLRPDEVRTLGVPVPDDDYDTVAGYLADRLDRLPEYGDEVEVDGWRLEVIRMDGLRVDRIRMTPVAAGTGGEQEPQP